MSKNVHLLPRLSEKTYGLSSSRVYVVDIERNVNKHTVKRAVEMQFDVKVIKVNLTNIGGKAKRSVSKNGRRTSNGRDNDVKKAYVTLAEGFSLPFFAAVEEEEKQAEKVQAEITKQQAAEAKPKRRIIKRKQADKETP